MRSCFFFLLAEGQDVMYHHSRISGGVGRVTSARPARTDVQCSFSLSPLSKQHSVDSILFYSDTAVLDRFRLRFRLRLRVCELID